MAPNSDEAEFLERLRPRGDESSDDRLYLERARVLLPNFPDDVLLQWVHRHDGSWSDKWAFLHVRSMTFVCELWPTERILSDVIADAHEKVVSVVGIGRWHDTRLDQPVRFMCSRGTWPRPIIVLDNFASVRFPGEDEPLPRWQLLEGHKRLGGLHGMRHHDVKTASQHELWIVSVDPALVMPEHPW